MTGGPESSAGTATLEPRRIPLGGAPLRARSPLPDCARLFRTCSSRAWMRAARFLFWPWPPLRAKHKDAHPDHTSAPRTRTHAQARDAPVHGARARNERRQGRRTPKATWPERTAAPDLADELALLCPQLKQRLAALVLLLLEHLVLALDGAQPALLAAAKRLELTGLGSRVVGNKRKEDLRPLPGVCEGGGPAIVACRAVPYDTRVQAEHPHA
jgi:hypothetical protein